VDLGILVPVAEEDLIICPVTDLVVKEPRSAFDKVTLMVETGNSMVGAERAVCDCIRHHYQVKGCLR
jgi:hypothetical protein